MEMPPEVTWSHVPEAVERMAQDARTTVCKWQKECFRSSAMWLRSVLAELWQRDAIHGSDKGCKYLQYVLLTALVARVDASCGDFPTEPDGGSDRMQALLLQLLPKAARPTWPDALDNIPDHQLSE